MRKPPWYACCVLLGLALVGTVPSNAAILVTGTNATTCDFSTRPLAADWSTLSLPGLSTDVTTKEQLNARIQNVRADEITNRCPASSATPPSSPVAAWSSAGFLQTSANANAATLLMATLRNDTGTDLTNVFIGYSLTAPRSSNEEIPGNVIYFSTTGAAGDWNEIVSLRDETAEASAGRWIKSTLVTVGSLAAGQTMFVLFVDDNAITNDESAMRIDDFTVATREGAASVIQLPQGDSIPEYMTVRLEATVPIAPTWPITYQWLKDGAELVGATNRWLWLTNGSPYPHWSMPSHSGGYVFVATAPGWAATSSVVQATIIPDSVPPTFLGVYDEDEFGKKMVRVVFSENLRNPLSDYVATSSWKVVTSSGPGSNWGYPTNVVWRYRGVDLQFQVGPDSLTRYYLVYTGPPLQDHAESPNLNATNAIPLPAHSTELLGFKSVWRYTDDAVDPGEGWHSTDYKDTDSTIWKEGPGVFDAKLNVESDCRNTTHYGFGSPGTCVRLRTDDGGTIITHYFRTRFLCPTPLRGVGGILKVSGIMENGGILYLNGSELHRVRMPQGPVTRYTEATTEMGDTAPHDFFYFMRPEALITGTNLLAAELHLVNFTSDLTLGLRVQLIDTEPLLPKLHIRRSAESGDVILTWETGWILQESSTMTGEDWTDLETNGTRVVSPTTSQKFYRLRL